MKSPCVTRKTQHSQNKQSYIKKNFFLSDDNHVFLVGLLEELIGLNLIKSLAQ